MRGIGPWERLNEEGAYEIIRVSLNATPQFKLGVLNYLSLPNGPITLQSISVVQETLNPGSGFGSFNELILTAKNIEVIKLNQVLIKYANGNSFNYDVTVFGYQILNTRYDNLYSSPLLTLKNNQFQLSDNILSTPGFIMPQGGDKIIISYEYKNLGRNVSENSVQVSQVLTSVREVVPPLLNKFNLRFAPIVSSSAGTTANFNGINFLDPLSVPPFSAVPSAFSKELPFKIRKASIFSWRIFHRL